MDQTRRACSVFKMAAERLKIDGPVSSLTSVDSIVRHAGAI